MPNNTQTQIVPVVTEQIKDSSEHVLASAKNLKEAADTVAQIPLGSACALGLFMLGVAFSPRKKD